MIKIGTYSFIDTFVRITNSKINRFFVNLVDTYYYMKLIPENRTLTCRDCGKTQTYANKYSYRRAMGISNLSAIKESNKGLCGKCRSKSEYRKEYDISEEGSLKMSLASLNRHYKTNCSSHEELFQHPNYIEKSKKERSFRRYQKAVDDMSRVQLKRRNPDLYELWKNNKYDGTNQEGLTIDHIQEKRYCFDNGISRQECADISNLQVITMEENIRKHNER